MNPKQNVTLLLQNIIKISVLQIETEPTARQRWNDLLTALAPPEEVLEKTLPEQLLWVFQNGDKDVMNRLRAQQVEKMNQATEES